MSKRKQENLDSSNKQTVTKKKAKPSFSCSDFKLMLKDPTKAYIGLEEFIQTAEDFPEKTDYDIINEFCGNSSNGQEIFQLFDAGKLKPGELSLIFTALELILLHITDFLTKYEAIAKNIVNTILTTCLNKILFVFEMRHKSGHIKSTLKLLRAMVMVSEYCAGNVLSQFNFTDSRLVPLFQRRDIKDPQDVRTCIIHFIISFLLVEDNSIIKSLLEQKRSDGTGLLSSIFFGISSDKCTTIEIILATVLEKIIMNPSITKTQKVKIFEPRALKQLVQLYNWKKPQTWKEKKFGKSVENDGLEDLSEEQIKNKLVVLETVHSFMQQLCCSVKYGIVFRDQSYGFSEMNQNHLMTLTLTSLPQDRNNEFSDELIVSILKTCPDQLHRYLLFIQPSLVPRESNKWFHTMQLLEKIYSAQPLVPPVLTAQEKHPPDKLVEILLMYFVPPTEILYILFGEVKHKAVSVRLDLLHFLAVVLQRILQLLQHIKTNADVGHIADEDGAGLDVGQLLKAAALKLIPDVSLIMFSWDKLVHEEQKLKPDQEEVNILEHTKTNQSDQESLKAKKYNGAITILRVLCLYRELSTSLTDSPSNLLKLITGIEKLDEDRKSGHEESSSHSSMPVLYLLKLLSVADSRKLMWIKESDDRHSILYMIMKMYIGQTDERIVRIMEELLSKMLMSTGLFDSQEEIIVWFQQLLSVDNENQNDVVLFMSKVFNSYIRYPYPYTDKVLELCGSGESMAAPEDESVEMLRNRVEPRDFNLENENAMSVDQSLQDEKKDTFRLPFCPVINAALDMMDKDSSGVREYLTNVVMKLFHLQVDPIPFCLLVDRYKHGGINDNLVTYISSFNTTKKIKSFKMKKIAKSLSALSKLLLDFYINQMQMDEKEFLLKFKRSLKTSTDENIVFIARQVLLYLTSRITNVAKSNSSKEDESSQFCVWMEILKRIISKAVKDVQKSESKMNESGEDENTFPEYEKEIKMFDVKQKTPLDCLADIVTNIFNHPVFTEYFLYVVGDHMADHISFISHTVTDQVAEYFHLLSPCFNKSGIGKSVVPIYLQKIVKTIDSVLTLGESKFLETCVRVLNCCKIYITSMSYSKIINQLLTMDSEDFVSRDNDQLSEIGLFIMEILQQLLDGDKNKLRDFDVHKINTFFTSIQHIQIGIDKLIQLYVDLLTVHPQFSLGVSEELLLFLLEENHSDCTHLAKLAVLFNSNLMDVMKVWFLDNKKKITDMKYTELIHVSLTVEHKFNSMVDRNFIDGVWKHYRPVFNSFMDTSAPTNFCFSLPESEKMLCQIFYKFLQMGAIDDDYLMRFWSGMTAKIVSTKSVSVNQIQLLCEIKKKMEECPDAELHQEVHKLYLTLIKCVIFSSKDGSSEDLRDFLLNNLATMSKENSIQEYISYIREEWNQFVKTILKVHYKNYKTHSIINDLIPNIYGSDIEEDDSGLLLLSMLYEMIFSHSAFLDVMLETGDDQLIESITDLLLCIATRTTKPLQSAHVAVLLGSYGGTLTLKDQKLLKLICVYESSGIELSEYRPFLWGKKAVVHHTVQKSLGASLWKHASVDQVLDNFDQIILQKSIDNFPVRRKLSPEVMYVGIDHKLPSECYDPCFVLPLFSHLLSPESVVNCPNFIEKNCLSYIFTALSSHEVNARKAAFHALTRFYQHLEGARFQEHKQCMYLMSVVRNSMEQSLFKIPCIISVFFSKICKLMMKPDEHMYPLINKFLLNNPDMELSSPPLFHKLFNSVTHENAQERSWMLTLLADGLTETGDYRIYERRRVFKLLLSYYNSGLSDVQTQLQILKIVKAACNVRSILLKLIKHHGLFTWINGIINTMNNNREKMDLIADIVHGIWMILTDKSIGPAECELLYQPVTITRQILLCLENLLMKSNNMTLKVLKTIILTMDAVLEHQKSTLEHLVETKRIRTSSETIGLSCICMLLQKACTIEGAIEDRDRFVRLLQAQGYSCDQNTFSSSQCNLPIPQKNSDNITAYSLGAKIMDTDVKAQPLQSDVSGHDTTTLTDNLVLTKSIISCCCHWNPKVTDVESRKTRNELIVTGVVLTASWIIRRLHQCGSDLILKFSHWFNRFIRSLPFSNKHAYIHLLNNCHQVCLFFELVELSSFVQSSSSESNEGDVNTTLHVLNDILFALGNHITEHNEKLECKKLFPLVKYQNWFLAIQKQRILSASSSNKNLSSRHTALFLMDFFYNAQNPKNTQEIMERQGLDILVKKCTPKRLKKK